MKFIGNGDTISGLWRAPKSFRHDDTAVAAVEFALVFPVMLMLLFGSAEYTRMVTASQRVSIATNAMVEILAQQPQNTTINDTQLGQYFDAMTPIMSPFHITSSNPTMTLSSITFWPIAPGSTTYQPLTDWSESQSGGTVRPCDVTLTIIRNSAQPAPNAVPVGMVPTTAVLSSTVLVADVSFSYPSPFNLDLGFYRSPPTITITRSIFNNPRNVGYVPLPMTGSGSNQTVDTTQFGGEVCESSYNTHY